MLKIRYRALFHLHASVTKGGALQCAKAPVCTRRRGNNLFSGFLLRSGLCLVFAVSAVEVPLGSSWLAQDVPTTSSTGSTRQLSTSEIAERRSSSVVTITMPDGVGSGVIVDPSGIIVTNLHVIQGQSEVEVRLSNGDIYDDITVLAVDERKDFVLLKLKAFGLPSAP